MKCIMIIPAKGFSRRIPRKNLRPFCGHPLVAWAIVQGLNARLVDEVWVSTDDEAVGSIAMKYGANVLYRRYKDTDETPGNIPVEEAIRRLLEAGRMTAEDPVLTHMCTYPCIRHNDFDEMVMKWRVLHESIRKVQSVAMRVEHRTLLLAKRIAPGVAYSMPELSAHNDYSGIQANHCTAVCTASAYIHPPADPGFGNEVGYYHPIEPWQLQDVDTDPEWEFAELVMEHYILQGRGINAYERFEDRAPSILR